MKHIIYKGSFPGYSALTRRSVLWTVEIWRTTGEAPASVGTLTFDGDTPVEIAYDSRAKYEPVVGSSCTLKIISPSDRTYADLYTIEAATIGVTIYLDGEIYWVGTLDPEFYEEPYERAEGYVVQLTFTDLGVLDRMRYTQTGVRSLLAIIEESADLAGLSPELTVDSSNMSLCHESSDDDAGEPASLEGIFVRSDNFYDEDGEALTMWEVLESILQPLALRVTQRSGKLWVYDLNGLYHKGSREEIKWTSDSQTLSVDEVKNNAKITWSPYAGTDELLPEECWPEDVEPDPNIVNMDSVIAKKVGDSYLFTYHLTQDLEVWGDDESERDNIPSEYWSKKLVIGAKNSNPDLTDAGFSLWLSYQPRNVEIPNRSVWQPSQELRSGSPVFKIVPQYDGQESEGVALRYPAVKLAESVELLEFFGKRYKISQNIEAHQMGLSKDAFSDASATPYMLFRTKEAPLPPIVDADADIKITMELLFDMRFNPFESAVDFKHPYELAEREKQWQKKFNFLYVPVRICYRQNGGEGRVFVFNRSPLYGRNDVRGGMYTHAESMVGQWVDASVTAITPLSYLAYYDPDDRSTRCGVFGWKKNRQTIPPFTGRLQTAISESDEGQFIAYPPKEVQGPQGGVLWIEVMSSRWWPLKGQESVRGERLPGFTTPVEWDWPMWILCKLPQVEIVSSTPLNREISDEDVEYHGVLNPAAKDDINLDTICGTKAGGIPTARGAYFDADGQQIQRMIRAGRKGQVEDLLIGTLYSQYAERHTALSGEAEITSGLNAFTERCQPDKLFITTAETQDLASMCGEHTFVELSADEYKSKETNV